MLLAHLSRLKCYIPTLNPCSSYIGSFIITHIYFPNSMLSSNYSHNQEYLSSPYSPTAILLWCPAYIPLCSRNFHGFSHKNWFSSSRTTLSVPLLSLGGSNNWVEDEALTKVLRWGHWSLKSLFRVLNMVDIYVRCSMISPWSRVLNLQDIEFV